MRKRRTQPIRRQAAGAPIRVTEERLALDLGISTREVRHHLRTGIEAGWVAQLGPGVFALTIPAGVRVD